MALLPVETRRSRTRYATHEPAAPWAGEPAGHQTGPASLTATDAALAAGSDPTTGAGGGRGGRASRVYLLGGGIALVCYLLFPAVAGGRWTFELFGSSALVALATGVAWYRPRPVLPWVLFILAQALFLTGDFLYYTFDLSFPSVGDGFYLAYYPFQAAALLLVIRSRTPGRDFASLLDALIIAVGFGLLSWVYLIGPYALHGDGSHLSRLVSMAYPTMDVLLLSVAARLIIGNGARSPALYLLSASSLCLVLTDVVYGIIELSGSYDMGGWLDGGWMITYLLWGAAALHPSMRDLSARAPASGASLSGKRILVLAAATLVAPATLMANSLWPVDEFNIPVAAMASAVLFVLVLTRMLGLVSSLREAVAGHARAERHETILRQAATALTVAPDREHIRHAAVGAAGDLVRGLPGVRITVEIWADEGLPGATLVDPTVATVVPLRTKTSTYGQLGVSSAAPVPTDVVDGLNTLGAQVALALESAALTEDLSRQRSESRVGALVQNSSDVILVLDAGLVIRYVTPSVSRVFGHSPEDLIGTPFALLADPSQRRGMTEYFSHATSRPSENAPGEWRMRCGDGQFTDVETVSTDLLAHPSVNGIVVTARDITERKALEAALERQIHELEDLDRIRGEFVATVSHELRTPLTSIIGQIEMLEDGAYGELSTAQMNGLEVIGRNSGRLFSLIEDLLRLSSIESSTLDLHLEPTSVASLMDSVLGQVERMAAARSVELTLDCGPGIDSVLLDREQLDRALLNLLTNAVKFTPAGGAVAVQARREAANLVVTISDTGVGIPEDEQAELFTRFFRSSVATRLAIQGTGLGLVIVKQIVEEHGGTVSIVSASDVGTTVTVTIPAGETPASQAATA